MLQGFEKYLDTIVTIKVRKITKNVMFRDKNAKEIDDLFPDLFEIIHSFLSSQIHFSAIGLFPFAYTTAKGFTCADRQKICSLLKSPGRTHSLGLFFVISQTDVSSFAVNS